MTTAARWFFWLTSLAAVALLAAGYLLAGRFWIVLPVALFALAGWLEHPYRWPWLASGALVFYLALAAGGVLLGVSPSWLVAGAAFALANWELAPRGAGEWEAAAQPGDPDSERARLSLLAVSILAGTAVAEIGLVLRIAIPFGMVVLSGLLALFSLYWFYRLISQEKKE